MQNQRVKELPIGVAQHRVFARTQLKRCLKVVVFCLRPPRWRCAEGGRRSPILAQAQKRPRSQVRRRCVGVVDLDGEDVLACQKLRSSRAAHGPCGHVWGTSVDQQGLDIAVREVPGIARGTHEVGRALKLFTIQVGNVPVVVVHGPSHFHPVVGRNHLKGDPEVQRPIVGDYSCIVAVAVPDSPRTGRPAGVVKAHVFP